jgi:segregation and condensation protein B
MSRSKPEEQLIIEHSAPVANGDGFAAPLGGLSPEELASELEADLAPDPDLPAGTDSLETPDAGEPLSTLTEARLRSVLESLLLVSDRPLSVARIVDLLEEAAAAPGSRRDGPPLYQAAAVQMLLVNLSADYKAGARGIELHQVAGAWQLRTAPDNAAWVQRLLQQKPARLARAQLEVLAIVAYRQPITRPEIDDVRGVDSGGALKMLLERRLVRILGKKEEPGRPLLYGTTREFLEFFNLRDLKDLPTLREYYDLSEENKQKVRAAHGEVPASAAEGTANAVQTALLDENGQPLPAPAAVAPDGAASATVPDSAVSDAVATGPAPLSRVEILDQQLADDAEHLAKIDQLISSVSTNFPSLESLLNPQAAPPAPSASAEPGPAADADEPADPAPYDDESTAEAREPEEL